LSDAAEVPAGAGAERAARNPDGSVAIPRAADDKVAGHRQRRAGVPHARALVRGQQFDPPARERPARRDIDRQPQRRARPRAAVGDPRVQVVGGGHARIDLRSEHAEPF